jgi:hypothetical protein
VPVLEQEQPIGVHGRRIDPGGHERPDLPRRAGEEEAILEERLLDEVVRPERQRRHDGVEFARAQLVEQAVRLRLAHAEIEREVAAAQKRQRCGKEVGRDGGDHPESQPPAQPSLPACDLGEIGDLADDPSRPTQDLAPRRRHHHLTRPPLDQLDPERRLQFADLHRQRRLAHVHGGRGAAEMPLLGQRNQVSELPDGDFHNLKLSQTKGNAISSYEQHLLCGG